MSTANSVTFYSSLCTANNFHCKYSYVNCIAVTCSEVFCNVCLSSSTEVVLFTSNHTGYGQPGLFLCKQSYSLYSSVLNSSTDQKLLHSF